MTLRGEAALRRTSNIEIPTLNTEGAADRRVLPEASANVYWRVYLQMKTSLCVITMGILFTGCFPFESFRGKDRLMNASTNVWNVNVTFLNRAPATLRLPPLAVLNFTGPEAKRNSALHPAVRSIEVWSEGRTNQFTEPEVQLLRRRSGGEITIMKFENAMGCMPPGMEQEIRAALPSKEPPSDFERYKVLRSRETRVIEWTDAALEAN